MIEAANWTWRSSCISMRNSIVDIKQSKQVCYIQSWISYMDKIIQMRFQPYLLTFPYISGMTSWGWASFNSLGPRQNCHHFAHDIFKCIFLNENILILLKMSLKFVPQVRINNISALIQIMAWRRPGDKPLSEPILISLLTHICVARPQWVNKVVDTQFKFDRNNLLLHFSCHRWYLH